MEIVEVEQDDVRSMRFTFPMGQQSGKSSKKQTNLAKAMVTNPFFTM